MWRRVAILTVATALAQPILGGYQVKRQPLSGAVTAPSCTTIVDDDFTGYATVSDHWSAGGHANCVWSISGNELIASNIVSANSCVATYLTTAGSADVWVKVRVASETTTSVSSGPAARFATAVYSDSGGYVNAYNDGTLWVEKWVNAIYSGDYGSAAMADPTAPYWIAMTITGTAGATETKVWVTASDPGVCPSNWGTATATITGCASCVNTGNYVGLFQYRGGSASPSNTHYSRFVFGTGN